MPLRKTMMPTLNVVNFGYPIPQMSVIDDMREWLDENNIVYRFKHNYNRIIGVYFDFEEEAMAFKLRWM